VHDEPRELKQLSTAESLRRLGEVSVGRVVFTDRALPAIRPVNHIVRDGDVIIRTHLGSAILPATRNGTVVAYEVDNIDLVHHLGWSVVVTGNVVLVSDPAEAALYQTLLRPWLDRPKMEYVLRIHPELVTGFELVPAAQ
jgi:nitroimidazol reductase NimA-like FMN-containing flavoprotein (pyridoxamine 5'-phosphate oxidase superfamily)